MKAEKVSVPANKDVSAMIDWCDDTLNPKAWQVLFDMVVSPRPAYNFYFKRTKDSTLFRLRWLAD